MKKLILFLLAAGLILSSCSQQSAPSGSSSGSDPAASGGSSASGKPDTWIADRLIKGRLFVGDASAALPDDQINNPTAQKIKDLTGITLEWEYTAGNSDMEVMSTCFASGDIPDIIVSYLDDSSRPEFSVLNKAAEEGMFADLVPLFKDTKVYSKYLDPDYLPIDSYKNVFMRDEYQGKGYVVQLQVSREPGSQPRDGISLYMNSTIADSIGVEPGSIKSSEDLFAAARKIKDGGFTDANGNPVMPIGPTVWGGRLEPSLYMSSAISSGRDTVFGVFDGKVSHISNTPYMLDEVNIVRQGLSEGLMDPEIFTMSDARAEEGFLNRHYGFMVMTNWQAVDKYYKTGVKYLPVINMADAYGNSDVYVKSKSPWLAWAISSKAENPEEIVKFADFMASPEGKLIWMYGTEGETYDLDADGKPSIKKELFDLKDSDSQSALQYNLYALGSWWGRAIGFTDLAPYEDFGEWNIGDKLNPEKAALSQELFDYGDPKITYYDGFPAATFLNDMPEDLQTNLKQFLDPSYFSEVFVQACFANSEDEAAGIIKDFRALLEKQGVVEFENYLQKVYDENPETIHFH